MRPQKLELAAFGPFKDKQIIDFAVFNQQDLFLVTGPTGSGKTYIFDAIMFALYGDTSGENRGTDEVISQYVEAGTPSYVNLIFLHQGDIYEVKRKPKQYSLTQKGKVRANPDSEAVEIYKNDTLVVSELREGKEYINALLGLDANQFRQIVLLPQGEFRKFLLSSSREKEAIFQNIFHTGELHDLQDELKVRKSTLEDDYKRVSIGRQTAIDSIQAGTSEALAKSIRDENTKGIMDELLKVVDVDKDLLEKNSKQADQLKKSLNDNETHLKVIEEKERLDEEWHLISEEKPQRDADKKQVEQHDKAVEVNKLEKDYQKKSDIVEQGNQLVAELNTSKKNSEKELETIKALFAEKEVAYKQIPEWKETVSDLNDKLGVFKILASYQDSIKKAEEAKTSLELKVKNDQQSLEDNQVKEEQLNKELEIIEAAEKTLETLRQKSKDLETEKITLEKRRQTFEQLNKAIDDKKKAISVYQAKEETYAEKQKDYQEAAKHFRMNQAGILAQSLEEDEPCPVCGSTHHPQVATLNETSVTEEKVDALNEVAEEAHAAVTEVNGQVIRYREAVRQLSENLDVSEENFADKQIEHKEQVEENNNEIARVAKDIQAQEDVVKHKEQVEKNRKDLIESSHKLSNDISGNSALIDNHETTIKETQTAFENESTAVADLEEQQVRTDKEELDKKISSSEKDYHKAKDDKAEIESDLKAIVTRIETVEKNNAERQNEAESALALFKEKLENSGFDSNYTELILSNDNYSEKQKAIKTFEEKQTIYKADRDKNTKALENIEEVKSKSEYRKIIEEIEKQQAELQKNRDHVNARLSVNQSSSTKLQAFAKENAEIDEAYKLASELADKANGNKQTGYISFERYVLGIYFDEIIAAANLRFKEMSNQQYYLVRSEGTKGGGGKGLDLDVVDNYTGKTRSVNTLSGGESFKASLSLAMGISDVVQNMNGGISIDTLFIDEGFGTLDPEALDEAIEALIELNTSGRMIGIISHVEELKTRIPARIEVEKTQEGSKIKTVV